MERARQEFLAGARLAFEQHGGARLRGACHELADVSHRFAVPDDAGQIVAAVEAAAQAAVLVDEPCALRAARPLRGDGWSDELRQMLENGGHIGRSESCASGELN